MPWHEQHALRHPPSKSPDRIRLTIPITSPFMFEPRAAARDENHTRLARATEKVSLKCHLSLRSPWK